MVGTLARHVAHSDSVQLVVHEGEQPIERSAISRSRAVQELRDGVRVCVRVGVRPSR
jgi:hypothetical protein